MKSISHKSYLKYKGLIIPIPNGNLGWYPQILKGLLRQADAMIAKTGSVLAVRLDINIGMYTKTNGVISTLRAKIRNELRRTFENIEVGYLWVRELAGSGNQHYHWFLLVDGRRVAPSRLTKLLIRFFEHQKFFSLHLPKNCYYLFKRRNSPKYYKFVERASYLAKTRSKESDTSGTNDYGLSRL